MDFNFITAEHLNLNVAMQAVSDLYKKEFAGTKTELFATQVIQNFIAPKIAGMPAQVSYLVIATIVNRSGNIVPLSATIKSN